MSRDNSSNQKLVPSISQTGFTNFRFQLRNDRGGDVTVWRHGYGLDDAKCNALKNYKGWYVARVWQA